jgi:Ca-activated chloride channel family protein
MILVGGLICAPLIEAQFQVDVNLVVLHVVVADHKGGFIRDLPESAFRVYEDGVLQKIKLFRNEDVPVAVGLVVDNSGSMQRKLPEVVAAALSFARSSNPEDQMFVVNFNEQVSMGLPSSEPFTSNPAELENVLQRIIARGQTALYDAVAAALVHVRESPLQKKVLIVVSDGGDNASNLRFPQLLTMVQQSEAIVYTIGIFDEYDRDRNPGVLKQLARISGGEAFFPQEAADTTDVLHAVSRDIRNQYTIGYVPSNEKRDGAFRSVRVKVIAPHAGRFTVRTRKGYLLSSPDTSDEPAEAKSAKEP